MRGTDGAKETDSPVVIQGHEFSLKCLSFAVTAMFRASSRVAAFASSEMGTLLADDIKNSDRGVRG